MYVESCESSWTHSALAGRLGDLTTLLIVCIFLQYIGRRDFPGGSVVKNPPDKQEIQVHSPSQEDSSEGG